MQPLPMPRLRVRKAMAVGINAHVRNFIQSRSGGFSKTAAVGCRRLRLRSWRGREEKNPLLQAAFVFRGSADFGVKAGVSRPLVRREFQK